MIIKQLEMEVYQLVGELDGNRGEEDQRDHLDGDSDDVDAELEAKFIEFHMIIEKLRMLVNAKVKSQQTKAQKTLTDLIV